MRRPTAVVAMILAAMACLLPVYAASPIDLAQVATVEDLAAEIDAKLTVIDACLKDQSAFEKAEDKGQLDQAGGVVACLAQAIVEHAEGRNAKLSPADLRDAALSLVNSENLDEAKEAREKLRIAAVGESSGSSAAEFSWDELIETHYLMEEVNTRFAALRRPIRNLKRGRRVDAKETALHATTLAVLALVIHADDAAVIDDTQRPQWQKLSTDMQNDMTALAAAIKRKDAEEANKRYLSGRKSCNECHRVFRDI